MTRGHKTITIQEFLAMVIQQTHTNGVYETNDIEQATFLMARGVNRIKVKPIEGSYHCCFILENPPQELLEEWLRGTATAEAKRLITNYRHNLNDARNAIRRREGVIS